MMTSSLPSANFRTSSAHPRTYCILSGCSCVPLPQYHGIRIPGERHVHEDSRVADCIQLFLLLETSYCIRCTVLDWFSTYLEQRTQHVRCRGHSSNPSVVLCGVPQGSVLGPILFILYIADLTDLVGESGLRPHLYGDNTQIYGFCSPDDTQAHPGSPGCTEQSNRVHQ